jgi:hypothetical protein
MDRAAQEQRRSHEDEATRATRQATVRAAQEQRRSREDEATRATRQATDRNNQRSRRGSAVSDSGHIPIVQKIRPCFSSSENELRDPELLDFTHFEEEIENAVMLFHLNRGIKHLDSDDPGLLQKQVDVEVLSHEEIQTMCNNFQTERGALAPIYACGCCGMKNVECTEMVLEDLGLLILSDEDLQCWSSEVGEQYCVDIPTSEQGDWKTLCVRQAKSIHASRTNSDLYYLHPELVQERDGHEYLQELSKFAEGRRGSSPFHCSWCGFRQPQPACVRTIECL